MIDSLEPGEGKGMESAYEKAMKKNVEVKSIPRGEGRPNRDTPISKDDVINLIIDLNTTNSVDEFLERV